MRLEFEKLKSNDKAPIDLLLLADPSMELVREYLDKGTCIVVKVKGMIVGTAICVENNSRSIEIMNIAVKEEYQNRGIGKKIITYIVDEAVKDGIKAIEIGTGNSSVNQMLLYQKCGFRIVGIDFDYFRRNYSEKILENGIECRDMIRMKIDLSKDKS